MPAMSRPPSAFDRCLDPAFDPYLRRAARLLGLATLATLLAACGTTPMRPSAGAMPAGAAASSASGPSAVPAAIAVPAGHRPVFTLVGAGELTYECRARADAPAAFGWAFVAPEARLLTQAGDGAGRYYGGPTWEASDGSRITGRQLAIAPAAAGAIPLQLVQVEPSAAAGRWAGVTFIQRLNTVGGVAPAAPCDASRAGARQTVPYRADYVFHRAG